MVLASVFRFCVLSAGFFSGESRRKVPSLAAMAVEPGPVALVGSPGHRITKNRFSEGRSLFSQTSVLHPLVCSTEEYCRGPLVSAQARWRAVRAPCSDPRQLSQP